MNIQPVDLFDRLRGTYSDRLLLIGLAGYLAGLESLAGLASAAGLAPAAPLASAAPLAPPLSAGDLLPYQEEYSNELRNSFFSPQVLQLPSLTAPFGGSITQWCTQPPSVASAVVSSAGAAFLFDDDAGLIYVLAPRSRDFVFGDLPERNQKPTSLQF